MAKVAILSFYSGFIERGVENFTREIAKRLISKHSITVFEAGQDYSWTNSLNSNKFKVISVKSFESYPKRPSKLLGKFYLDWWSIKIALFSLKIVKKIIKEKYDVIIPLNGGWQTAILRLVSKISKSKIIISGHAGIGFDDAWNLFFRPDIFVALTTPELKWARKLAPEVKTVLIPNGVDLSRFNPKVIPKSLNLKRPIVVCASALVPYKRLELTIKAVAKAESLSLLILGDGEMRGQIDSLGKRTLGKRYLRKIVPYQEMPSYYSACDVFTLASKTEAFGTSYIEAMACNLPVVTTGDNSRSEIIGEAGILTDPLNVDQYARDLLMAAKTNYRNKPYEQSLKFSWNKQAKKYSQLISQIT